MIEGVVNSAYEAVDHRPLAKARRDRRGKWKPWVDKGFNRFSHCPGFGEQIGIAVHGEGEVGLGQHRSGLKLRADSRSAAVQFFW